MKKTLAIILCLGLFVAISHRAHAQDQPKVKTEAELQEEALFKPYKMEKVTIDIEYPNKKVFLERMKLQTQAILEVLGYEKEKAVASFRSSVYSESQQQVKETKENDTFKFTSQFDSKVYVVSSNEVQCPYHVISDSISEHRRKIRVAKVEINCTIFPKRTEVKKPEVQKQVVKKKDLDYVYAEIRSAHFEDYMNYNQCLDLNEAFLAESTPENKLLLITKLRSKCGRCKLDIASNGSDNYVMTQYRKYNSEYEYHYLRMNQTGDVAISNSTNDSWLSMEKTLGLISLVLKLGYCNPEKTIY